MAGGREEILVLAGEKEAIIFRGSLVIRRRCYNLISTNATEKNPRVRLTVDNPPLDRLSGLAEQ